MATGNGNSSSTLTKGDLQDMLDEVEDILNSIYTPEASREDLVAGVGQALDVIEGNEPDDDGEGDDDPDSDYDGQ